MILITEYMDEGAIRQLQAVYPTSYLPDLADRQEHIAELMPGVRALIVRNRTRVTAELLGCASDLQVIGRLGVGLDNIDLDSCNKRGIKVIPATGANARSVAEYVIASILILFRNAYQAKEQMLAGAWPRSACATGMEVSGRLLGLVGYGAIARETARLARALGMGIAACDPHLPEQGDDWQDTERKDFTDLLQSADVVSLHVPLNRETHHLIDAQALAAMRHGSFLIHAARGGVVDEKALIAAMRSGHIAGAALDVFESEPLDSQAAEKFSAMDNLLLTPHIAGVTHDSNVRVSAMIAELVAQHLANPDPTTARQQPRQQHSTGHG